MSFNLNYLESYHSQLKKDIFDADNGLVKLLAREFKTNDKQHSFAQFALGKSNQSPEIDNYIDTAKQRTLFDENERQNYVGLFQIIKKMYGQQLPSSLYNSLDELEDNLRHDDRQTRVEKIEQLHQAKDNAFQPTPPSPQSATIKK